MKKNNNNNNKQTKKEKTKQKQTTTEKKKTRLAYQKFRSAPGTTLKVVLPFHSKKNFEKFNVNGKQPV